MSRSRISSASAILAWLLVLAMASQSPAQTVIPFSTGQTFLRNNPASMCLNMFYVPECVPCECREAKGGITQSTSGPPHNPDCQQFFEDLRSASGSFVPHSTYNYHHSVLDYWPGSPAGGCTSCGGGGALGGSELMSGTDLGIRADFDREGKASCGS